MGRLTLRTDSLPSYHQLVAPCTFCPRDSAGDYALTRQSQDTWERVIEPVCRRCWAALDRTQGRLLKATGERWLLGHGVGSFDAKGIRR